MLGRLRLVRSQEAAGAEADTPSRSGADRTRLAQMFAAHHATVWRILRRRGLSADAAGDVVQETFMIAGQRLGDIHVDSERAFLVGTAVRVAHSLARKTVRWQLEDDMDRHVADLGNLAEEQSAIQLCDLVLSKIDSDLAEVFVMVELEGLSSPEIAALLEIPLGTVASRLRRAREQFRAVVSRLTLSMRREGAA